MNRTRIKNCGLKSAEHVAAAIAHDADYLGFIHYPGSPRDIAPEEVASILPTNRKNSQTVAVTVGPTDTSLNRIISAYSPDLIQLHGEETPERIAEVKQRFDRPVIKAIAVQDAQDVISVEDYADVADHLLFDTKLKDVAVHGGSGLSFDWQLLKHYTERTPYFLSGGLTVENIWGALSQTNAAAVDVSSGIELRKGEKDVTKIQQFNDAVRAYDQHRN